MNDLADLHLPAELIAGQLKRLETAPTLCVAGIWTTAFGVLAVIVGRVYLCAPVFLIGPGLWIAGIQRFLALGRGKPGWFAVLAWFHLLGIVPIACLTTWAWLRFFTSIGGVEELFDVCLGLAGFGVMALYSVAKRRLAAYGRETVAELARQRLE